MDKIHIPTLVNKIAIAQTKMKETREAFIQVFHELPDHHPDKPKVKAMFTALYAKELPSPVSGGDGQAFDLTPILIQACKDQP